MMLTAADYERALRAFSQDLAPADKQIAAAYLFGSMAQGRLTPGVSDLDFWVFLEPGVLADRLQLGIVLQTLVTATRALQKRGIPVENACGYAGLEEIASLPRLVVSNLGVPEASRLLRGRDVRSTLPALPGSGASHDLATFVELRRAIFLPAAAYLGSRELSLADRQRLYSALRYAKYVPEAACAALGTWPGEHDALAVLATLLPGVTLAPIAALRQFVAQPGAVDDGAALCRWLRTLLSVVEQINDCLMGA